ncbi:hypothetical protein [Alloactinosynnema sp. L-07]|uniref:hypothetical protein n=1 Tax=Alloactinosynnema sp. L-07 TaxID=1653480 RepID=UPI000B089314|nr:hypothetical protein [Alloactinosynnema sp. L-07]
MLGLLPVTQASAQTTSQPAPSVGIKPNTGPAGSTFTAFWSNAPCRDVRILWAGTTQIGAAVAISGSATATVPSTAKPGSYTVAFSCSGKTTFGTETFRIPAPPTTTTTPPPVVTTTTTRPPVVTTTTTRPPVTTTTTRRPPTTTTTPPGVTTTTDGTPPSTTDTPPTDTAPPITDVPEPKRDLVFDRDAIQPGDSVEATGKGCTPGSSVELVSGGQRVGSTTADSQGQFRTKIQFSKIEPGRHLVAADCGILLTGTVDQLVTSSTGGSSSTLVVLVFFVLAGAALIRFT